MSSLDHQCCNVRRFIGRYFIIALTLSFCAMKFTVCFEERMGQNGLRCLLLPSVQNKKYTGDTSLFCQKIVLFDSDACHPGCSGPFQYMLSDSFTPKLPGPQCPAPVVIFALPPSLTHSLYSPPRHKRNDALVRHSQHMPSHISVIAAGVVYAGKGMSGSAYWHLQRLC